ncbi:MAG: M24 family metallopeptidase [Parvibaculaceae bacterium]
MSDNAKRFAVREGTGALVEPLPFSGAEYERRLGGLHAAMAEASVDVFMSFTPENLYYLTGNDSPGYYFYLACVVAQGAMPVNVLRRVESTNTLWRSWSRRVVVYGDRDDPVAATLALLDDIGVKGKRIGLEAESFFITPRRYRELEAGIGKRGGKVVDAQLVEPLRLIKSDEELAYIRKAARIVEMAMRAAIDASRAGVTEDDVAGAMWQAMVAAGGEYAGLPPFIATGPRSSLCHATWAGRRLMPGDLLSYELPGVMKRYVAPLFRCGTVGPASDDMKRLADACRGSLEAAIAAIRPGATSEEIHAASRGNFERTGYGDLHGHRTAYSVGINYPPDWGEGHIMSLWPDDTRELQAGMTFHLVPGVIVPEKYLISVTETVLVTETGCEVITDFPRELFEV